MNNTSSQCTNRARIIQTVGQLTRYNPNLNARSLATGKRGNIGVIVSNIENPFFPDICKAVERRAHRDGYEVILANTGYNPQRLTAGVLLMLGHRVAGLAAVVPEMDQPFIEDLGGYGIPVAYYGGGAPRQNGLHIRAEYQCAMERLISCLYGLGHRRVGFLSHHFKSGAINQRLDALLRVAPGSPDLQLATAAETDSLEAGRYAAHALLTANPGVTALICANDWMAVGALRALRERGLRVPRDISVTGFDNVNLAQFCFPGADVRAHSAGPDRPGNL